MPDFVQQALLLSLQVALATVLLSTPPALLLATLMARRPWPGKWLLEGLILLPMALPPAVVGLVLASGLGDGGALGAWLHALTGWRLRFFPLGAILAATLMALPLMVRVLRPALEASDPMLLPVARTLGATPWQGWFTVTLPMAWPAVASAMALGLAAAWGESGATLVLAAALSPQDLGDVTTAPLALIAALQHPGGHPGGTAEGQLEAAWQLAWVSLGVALSAVLLSEWGRRHWRRRWQAHPQAVGTP